MAREWGVERREERGSGSRREEETDAADETGGKVMRKNQPAEAGNQPLETSCPRVKCSHKRDWAMDMAMV